jgi:phospholipase C
MATIMRAASMMALSLLILQVTTAAPLASSTGGGTQTPIKHVIMIMLENHSFDNVFGFYPAANGSTSNPLLLSIQRPDDLAGVSPPGPLTPIPNGTYATVNPDEGVYPADWDNGKMDGFASNSGSQSMTYFTSSQFAIEWDWAVQYAIGDSYFAACLCETNPNRLASLSGFTAGLTTDSGPPPYVPVNQSIMGELNHYGISWAYYIDQPQLDNYPLNYFDGIGAYSANIQSWADFDAALAQGTLPAVTWVMPVGGGSPPVSQHPEQNVTSGEQWLLGVVDRVMNSGIWDSSAIFITYDEGGGYYDHVPPPTTAGQQLGFRVPLFVISPYAKENYVSHTVMNHASQIAFVDYNWGLPAVNTFVADSGLPLDMFDFPAAPRAPVILSNSSQFPVTPQIPFDQVAYYRTGSTDATLSSLGAGTYVQSNSTITPFYESTPFAIGAGVVLIALLYVVSRFARSKRRASQVPVSGTSV